MAVVPKDLFASSSVDFEQLLQPSLPSGDLTDLEVRTLAGVQHTLAGLGAQTTLAEVKQRVVGLTDARQDSLTAPMTIKLFLDNQVLDCAGQTLAEVGLAKPNASVTLVRCPADRPTWVKLFTDLLHAIEGRRAEEARRLVDQGAGLDSDGNILRAGHGMRLPGDWTAGEREPGNTMLHLALRHGLLDLAAYLISKGVDIDACSDLGRTPLMMAVLKKQPILVEALLRAQADLSTRDYLGNTALAYALKAGNDELCAQLVDLGGASPSTLSCGATFAGLAPSSPIVQRGDDILLSGQFPVLTCCACGLPLTAAALLRQGAGHGGADRLGRTALHYANGLDKMAYGPQRAALLDILFEKGADAGALDNFGNLPERGVLDPLLHDTTAPKCTVHARSLWQWIS